MRVWGRFPFRYHPSDHLPYFDPFPSNKPSTDPFRACLFPPTQNWFGILIELVLGSESTVCYSCHDLLPGHGSPVDTSERGPQPKKRIFEHRRGAHLKRKFEALVLSENRR